MKNQTRKICGTILFSLLLTFVLVLLPMQKNRAAGGVTVNLAFRDASATQGETVTLDVSFSSFPSITRFGPIEVGYDTEALEFQDITIGKDLKGFELTYEMSESGTAVVFSAVNAKEEEDIIQGSTGEDDESSETSNVTNNREDAFSSENPVIVATIRFTVKNEARGEIKAWLGSISGLRDNMLESVVAGAGNNASFIVQAMVSSDATLSDLNVGTFKLEPEFDPGIFSYKTTVSKNVTDVAIHAVAYNLNSTVSVEGESNLVIGSNTATITVTAEDGEHTEVYTIEIYRSEALLVENVQFEDKDGQTFTFAPFPETLVIPANFYQSSCIVDGTEVPCFRRDDVASVLLYCRKPDSRADLYVYNQETDTMRRYEPGKMVLRSSMVLTAIEKPSSVMVPEGFSSSKIKYGSGELDGYVSKDGSTRIVYLQSEDGTAKFYVVESSGDVYPYRAPKTNNSLFLYLCIVCASIAVVEAAIIGFLVYRRKAYFRKVNPRRV